jgi:hypothetical protein
VANYLNNFAVFVVYAQFTNVAGCIIQAGRQRVGDPRLRAIQF